MICGTPRPCQVRGLASWAGELVRTPADSIGTTRKDQIMGIRFLSPAVISYLLLNTMVTLTSAAAQTAAQHTALASDSNFIQMAMSLGLLQVKLGKLAQDKGSSDGVREFGKRMVADYSKVNEQLAAGAKQAAYPHPVLLRQHQQTFNRFNTMSRSSFDQSYMTEMVSGHTEAARLFEDEAKNGRVQLLKQLATSLPPGVQQDQSLAIQAAGVGSDVTASASRER